jgi:hypothetical protein
MIKHHTESMDEIRHELQQERLTNQKRSTPRPLSVPEFTSVLIFFLPLNHSSFL